MKRIWGITGIFLIICTLLIGAVGCVSPSAFKIKISSPQNNVVATESTVTVTGKVSGYTRGNVIADDTTLRLAPEVTVNGVKTDVAEDGTFSTQVELVEGSNTIKAVAMFNNLTVKDSIKVTYTPSAPALTIKIGSPANGAELTGSPAEVKGTVSDATATVTVNDVAAEVVEDGAFTAQVELAEGENTITAKAVLNDLDAADSIKVTYKAPAPGLSIEITSPADDTESVTDKVTITGQVNDPAAEVKVNDAETEVDVNGAFSAQVTLSEGENTIEAVATKGELQATDSIKITYTPPAPSLSVKISSPEDGAELTESPVTVTGTVSNASAAVKVNDVEAEVAEDGTFTAQVELTEGENTIAAKAALNDAEGTDSITVTYTAPAPAPTLAVEITSPIDGATVTDSAVTVTGTVSDAEADVKVKDVDAAVAEDGTFTAQLTLVPGANTIKAVATLGDETVEDNIVVTYAPPAPALTVEITSPEDGAVSTTNTVTVNGTVSDAEAEVKVNGTAVEVAEDKTFTTQVTLVKGENTIEAMATKGEIQAADSIKVTYTAPALSLEVNTNPLTVTGKVSNPAAKVTVNGVEATVAEDGTFTAQVTLVPGENTITVIAELDGEQTTYSFKVTYAPPTPDPVLTLAVDSPAEGAALTESPVTLTGKVSNAAAAVTVNDAAVTVAEDGSFSAPVSLTEGQNTITVKATLEGQEPVTKTITVTYTAPTPTPTLAVVITSPEDGSTVSESSLTVTGTVSNPAATVTVNGVAATVAEDGTFTVQIELTEGANTIAAAAVSGELQAQDSLSVTYTPAP